MKKVIGVILVFIMTLFVILYMKSSYEMVTVQEEKEIEIDNIKELNFLTSATDIEIKAGSTNLMKVKIDGEIPKKLKKQYSLRLVEDKNRLEVSYLSKDNRLGIKLGGEKDVVLQVTLPERTYKNLSVQTTSGDIDSDGVSAEKIKLNSTSGDQAIKGLIASSTLSIQSTSGDIKLNHSELNDFSIVSTSGSVETDSLVSKKGKIKTTSGNVNMIIVKMIYTLSVATTSGDVKTSFGVSPESLRIDFKGNSGKADIKLKKFMPENIAENSAVGVIGEGANNLKVRTTSGDFIAK